MYSEQTHYLVTKLKEMASDLGRVPMASDFQARFPNVNVTLLFGSYDGFLRAAGLLNAPPERIQPREPKILTLDIETKPMKVWTFGIRDQYISHDQIIEDWSVMSWAAKWRHSDEVFYQDVSQQSDYSNDELIMYGIWELINEADVVIGQNSKRFDIPKLNTRFEKHKLGRPSPFKHIDALNIKRRHFGLTSNKLDYTTNFFNEKYKKLKHERYPGLKLWTECLNGNQDAWLDMKAYNVHDVLALEEEYFSTLIRWDNTINYGAYTQQSCCPNCGSTELKEAGIDYTKTGAFYQYKCGKCGAYSRSKTNELTKAMRKELMK